MNVISVKSLGLLTAAAPSSHGLIRRKGRKRTRHGALPLLTCRPALLPLRMRKFHPQTPRSHDWVTHQRLNETLDPPSLTSGNLYYTQNKNSFTYCGGPKRWDMASRGATPSTSTQLSYKASLSTELAQRERQSWENRETARAPISPTTFTLCIFCYANRCNPVAVLQVFIGSLILASEEFQLTEGKRGPPLFRLSKAERLGLPWWLRL